MRTTITLALVASAALAVAACGEKRPDATTTDTTTGAAGTAIPGDMTTTGNGTTGTTGNGAMDPNAPADGTTGTTTNTPMDPNVPTDATTGSPDAMTTPGTATNPGATPTTPPQ